MTENIHRISPAVARSRTIYVRPSAVISEVRTVVPKVKVTPPKKVEAGRKADVRLKVHLVGIALSGATTTIMITSGLDANAILFGFGPTAPSIFMEILDFLKGLGDS